MTKLTQKKVKFEWGDKQEAAFQLLKQKLCSAPILALPEGSKDFIVYCDASIKGSGYHQKDRKPSQNDKTEHGMEKTVQNQGQSPKMPKPEPELKNTVGCNLNPSDGPGKPNSIFMKTVKTKWALNQLQQPICVQLTKTVKTLKGPS
ncbi:putative reverse transcriptase domain-containing protein [Tanacetum coccineum]